jgi:hypothetical protein
MMYSVKPPRACWCSEEANLSNVFEEQTANSHKYYDKSSLSVLKELIKVSVI